MKRHIYRTVGDILAQENDPYYPGVGFFGRGTYYRPGPTLWKACYINDESEGSDAQHWGLIFEFEADINPLLFHEDNNCTGLARVDLVQPQGELKKILKKTHIDPYTLPEITKKAGFDSFELTGADDYSVEGGMQIVIPRGKKPKMKFLSLTILVKKKAYADLIQKALRRKPIRTTQKNYEFGTINKSEFKKLDSVLKSIREKANAKVAA